MNTLYYWNHDIIVDSERMEDTKREVELFRLLRDAGISNPSLYERTAVAFGNILVKLGQRLQRKYTNPHQVYQTTSEKYAA